LGKESFLPFLAPKSHFRWLGVPFKLEDTGSNFGGYLDGGWKGFPSLKIWKRSNKKWGKYRGPKMGFQIADNSYAQMNGKDARR